LATDKTYITTTRYPTKKIYLKIKSNASERDKNIGDFIWECVKKSIENGEI